MGLDYSHLSVVRILTTEKWRKGNTVRPNGKRLYRPDTLATIMTAWINTILSLKMKPLISQLFNLEPAIKIIPSQSVRIVSTESTNSFTFSRVTSAHAGIFPFKFRGRVLLQSARFAGERSLFANLGKL